MPGWWMCPTCRREDGGLKGWRQLPDYPETTLCPRSFLHGNMLGPFDERDPSAVAELRPVVQRRPDIQTINLFFQNNTAPKGPIDNVEMDLVMFETNKVLWYKEFQERILSIKADIEEKNIVDLWTLMVRCFSEKDVRLAHAFLDMAADMGLQRLETPSPRVFWSGAESRKKAYEVSQPPPEPTALEKTDIGRLLDKLSVFKSVPWDLSTILWALVSRMFGMGATGDIHVYMDGGFAKGNVFWNDELPILRLMQRYGAVEDIILHIWHTRDSRWLPEFSIQSDKLLMVFDKARRVPAPTLDNPNQTRSYRYDRPLKISALRRVFERFLQSGDREHPLILYNYRKATCIYATAQRYTNGLAIKLFEYDSDQTKMLFIITDSDRIALEQVPTAEKFLMANYQLFAKLPKELSLYENAFVEGRDRYSKILAIKTAGEWHYRMPFIRDFTCTPGIGMRIIAYLAEVGNAHYVRTKYGAYTSMTITAGIVRNILEDLFEGPIALDMSAQERIEAINTIRLYHRR